MPLLYYFRNNKNKKCNLNVRNISHKYRMCIKIITSASDSSQKKGSAMVGIIIRIEKD